MSLSVQHLPLAGYAVTIGATLSKVLPVVFKRRMTPTTVAFLSMAAGGLALTWYHMILFFQKSFTDSATRHATPAALYTSAQWLTDVSLFQEAWEYVCDGAERWWWSQQLCQWTVGPLTLLMATEGHKFGVKRQWAFMLLGQLVAVSVAQSLFFAAVVSAAAMHAAKGTLAPIHKTQAQTTYGTLAAILIATASTVFVPQTIGTWRFLPNLVAMHAVILLPFVPAVAQLDKPTRPRLSRLYLNYAFIAMRFQIPVAMQLFSQGKALSLDFILERLPEFYLSQWAVLTSHPAQASISWDVIFTSVSALTYLVWSSRSPHSVRPIERVSWQILLALIAMTPLVGVAASVSIGLAVREGRREAAADAEIKFEKARREQRLQQQQEGGATAVTADDESKKDQ
ncbi:hypothetical protein C6P46_006634 [Rhodotorula mucilaginosa]|uniref:Uncharacterized protein n=1 Tax=Rhodotorula mucilaginosa TaxID=5537 RepID=A0A9P7B425_RHOMI|nr:hypothetical protein C6P46_006634 [Rhodotorula mucilaginosa]